MQRLLIEKIQKGMILLSEPYNYEEPKAMSTIQEIHTCPLITAMSYTEDHSTLDQDAYNEEVYCNLLQDQLQLTKKPNGYESR